MKRIRYIVFSALVLIFLSFSQFVRAESVVNGLFVADENVNTTEKLDGTSFQAGRNIKVSSAVSGILFAAGENVSVTGESDYLFAAGRLVTLNNKVENDAFVAGMNVILDKISIGRDLYIGGESISLSGDFGRNVYAGGSTVVLDGVYKGDVTVDAEHIEVGDGVKIVGILKYNDKASLKISEKSVIGAKETYKSVVNNEYQPTKESLIKAKAGSILFGLANGLVLGLLMLWLMPYVFEKLVSKNSNLNFGLAAKRFGWGLLLLIVLPILFIISLITVVGVGVGVLMITFYGLVIGLSGILVGYLLGQKLRPILFKDKKNKYLDFIIGYVVLMAVKTIPVLGGIISLMTVVLGLGLGFNLLIERKQTKATVRVNK